MSDPVTLGRRQFLACALGAAANPAVSRANGAVIAHPFVQHVRDTAATVRWATSTPEDAVLEVEGPEGVLWQGRVEPSEFATGDAAVGIVQKYSARIAGLRPGTEYSYRIRSASGELTAGSDFTFRTPGTGQPFRFLAVGDSGTGSAAQRELADLMRRDRPALVVHTGDIAYPSATFRNLKSKYLDIYQAQMRRVPFFPSLGNHDYWDNGEPVCRQLHDLPRATAAGEAGLYYSFDWGDVHFVALDSNRPLERAAHGADDMLRWLEADLATTKKFWRVAFFHHPPYAAGPNWSDPLSRLAEAKLAPILERFGVPLVLNGHEHNYQRTYPMRGGRTSSGGTVYLTTGGGGADLYRPEDRPWIAAKAMAYHYVRFDVDGRKMTFTAVGRDGQAIDTADIVAAPSLFGDVVSAAGTATLGSGAVISLFGAQFALRERSAGGDVLPRSAADVWITLGEADVPLIYASPGQVNAVLPPGVTGVHTLRISTSAGQTSREIEIRPLAPAIFPGGLFEGSRQITADSPCSPGCRVSAFLTGAENAYGRVQVLLGTSETGGRIDPLSDVRGIQRLEFDVPNSVSEGVLPLSIRVRDVGSNVVPFAVSAR
jgi:acid phosphatase type 7